MHISLYDKKNILLLLQSVPLSVQMYMEVFSIVTLTHAHAFARGCLNAGHFFLHIEIIISFEHFCLKEGTWVTKKKSKV